MLDFRLSLRVVVLFALLALIVVALFSNATIVSDAIAGISTSPGWPIDSGSLAAGSIPGIWGESLAGISTSPGYGVGGL